jgi:uncharacterized protein YbaR (Trm112 family)
VAVADLLVASEQRPAYGSEAPPEPLRRGGMLRCPDCEAVHPEWRFEPRPRNPLYADQLHPVLKCPACKHHFSLKE